MQDSDGGISVSEQVAHGSSYNITAANHNGVLALDFNASLLEKHHHTLRGAWDKEWLATTLCKLSNVCSTKAIDILLSKDSLCDDILRDVLGDRELDKDSMDRVVIVQLGDLLKQLCFSDLFREVDQFTQNASLYNVSPYLNTVRAMGQWLTSSAAFSFMRT